MFKSFLERSGENIILSPSIIKEKSNLFPFLESLSFFSSLRKIFFEFHITGGYTLRLTLPTSGSLRSPNCDLWSQHRISAGRYMTKRSEARTRSVRRVGGKIYLYRYITFSNRYHIVLMSTTNARITINTESPISNQMGFVFRDIKLPIRAPLIDPTITHKAGRNIMLP